MTPLWPAAVAALDIVDVCVIGEKETLEKAVFVSLD